MSGMNLGELRERREALLARPVWRKSEAREYHQVDSFLKYADRLERLFKGAKYERVK